MARNVKLILLAFLMNLVFIACDSDQQNAINSSVDLQPKAEVSEQDNSPITIDVNIDTRSERKRISPYIYGVNQDLEGYKTATRRLGGNRTTGYNWENNASNAGSDWLHFSDNYLPMSMGIDEADYETPGIVATTFHNQTLENRSLSCRSPYSLITLQAAGYVSADKNGAVLEAEVAPSARWKEVKFAKDGALSLVPDLTDDYVYMDEFVNFLVQTFGNARRCDGIRGYSVDNEPALWSHTHVRIHPEKPTCDEIVARTAELSKAVKNVDAYAEIFGPALYGFNAYRSFQDADDWAGTYQSEYTWFVDFFLDKMKKRSDEAGKRLLDVFDIHYYSEARGGGYRVTFDYDPANIECNKARLQAPRTLWQGSYVEDSWITQWTPAELRPFLPRIQESISQYYPGTKLAVTEYDFGAGNSITGGIAQADTLGIFSENNVYLATYWGSENKKYIAAAMNLYKNYDGKNSGYGNVSVKCDVSDDDIASAYASVKGRNTSKAHVILLNKNYDQATTFNVTVAGNKKYNSATVWGFDRNSNLITKRMPVYSIKDNTFTITLPALSAYHVVLSTKDIKYGDINHDRRINSRDVFLLEKLISIGISEYFERGDLNLDGVVDAADLEILKSYVAGTIDSLPYVQVDTTAPAADFSITPAETVTDEEVTLDASASVDEESGISYYAWDLGDGTESSGKVVKHKFSDAGTYTIKLTVANDFGYTSTISKTIVITSATGDNSKIGFESDLEGFYTGTPETTTVSLSNEKAFKGNSSLKLDITGTEGGNSDAKVDTLVVPPGSTITFRVWVPADAPIASLQPYCMPHNADWSDILWYSAWGGYSSLQKDAWNELSFELPADTDETYAQQLGIQVQTSGEEAFSVYVDSIDW